MPACPNAARLEDISMSANVLAFQAVEESLIRFEICDGMRRVSCAVSNDALDTASGMTDPCTAASRRRSFERFRTLVHAAALLRLEAQLPGSVDPIIVTDADLRSVPPQVGTPRFGTSGKRPALPIAFEPAPGAEVALTVAAFSLES
jgi:hypothetical protein